MPYEISEITYIHISRCRLNSIRMNIPRKSVGRYCRPLSHSYLNSWLHSIWGFDAPDLIGNKVSLHPKFEFVPQSSGKKALTILYLNYCLLICEAFAATKSPTPLRAARQKSTVSY